MSIKSVALIGANGKIGEFMLDALVRANFQVTVLQRQSSRSKPLHAEKIRIVSVPDDLPVGPLKSAFEKQDAAIICMPLKDVDQHLRLAEAAAAAGVKRYIPADFGSVDAGSKKAQELVKLFGKKTKVQERLTQLVSEHPSFSWTSLVNGHFFDWALRANFMHFDLTRQHADILGSGDQKSSLSTLSRIADATLRILDDSRLEKTKNRVLFIQSFLVSQNDVLHALEKATKKQWSVQRVDADEFIRTNKEKSDAGDLVAVEELVFALGVIDGNWESRPDFAMELLGLQNEDLQKVVDEVVQSEGL